jgi:hypothetical protein
MPQQPKEPLSPVAISMDISPEESKEEEAAKMGRNSNTVIFLDWDDTLLPSSFLSGKGYRLDTEVPKDPEHDAQLREVETSSAEALTQALKLGHVHVVTNAETGWVQLSAQKFMPGLVPLLSKVRVISARSTYEGAHPDAPLKWKFLAMQEALTKVYGGLETKAAKNVISFGDSHVEREAVRAVTRGVPNVRTKSVKFAERPSLEQLRRQLDLICNCMQYICSHEGDLDLQLTVTVANKPATPPPAEPTTPTDCSGAVPMDSSDNDGIAVGA